MKNSDVSDYVMNCAIELIKQFEGCSLKAYLCPANIWTIGYGHTKCVKNGDVITFDKAEELLKDDIYFLLKVLDRVEVFLTDNQKVALISLIFNIGQTNFLKSTLFKKLNKSDFLGASIEFDRWIYSKGKVLKGLQNRRKKEKKIFLSNKNISNICKYPHS